MQRTTNIITIIIICLIILTLSTPLKAFSFNKKLKNITVKDSILIIKDKKTGKVLSNGILINSAGFILTRLSPLNGADFIIEDINGNFYNYQKSLYFDNNSNFVFLKLLNKKELPVAKFTKSNNVNENAKYSIVSDLLNYDSSNFKCSVNKKINVLKDEQTVLIFNCKDYNQTIIAGSPIINKKGETVAIVTSSKTDRGVNNIYSVAHENWEKLITQSNKALKKELINTNKLQTENKTVISDNSKPVKPDDTIVKLNKFYVKSSDKTESKDNNMKQQKTKGSKDKLWGFLFPKSQLEKKNLANNPETTNAIKINKPEPEKKKRTSIFSKKKNIKKPQTITKTKSPEPEKKAIAETPKTTNAIKTNKPEPEKKATKSKGLFSIFKKAKKEKTNDKLAMVDTVCLPKKPEVNMTGAWFDANTGLTIHVKHSNSKIIIEYNDSETNGKKLIYKGTFNRLGNKYVGELEAVINCTNRVSGQSDLNKKPCILKEPAEIIHWDPYKIDLKVKTITDYNCRLCSSPDNASWKTRTWLKKALKD